MSDHDTEKAEPQVTPDKPGDEPGNAPGKDDAGERERSRVPRNPSTSGGNT